MRRLGCRAVREIRLRNPRLPAFLDEVLLDAYQFATQAVESPLANVCDTNYTCVAKLRKQWLPARETHRGMHARLREIATTLQG